MNNPDLKGRFETLRRVAKNAGQMALESFRTFRTVQVEAKGTADYVSEADRAVEAFVRNELLSAYPEDGFFGEESGGDTSARFVWVVDPIDGTHNFLRGIPLFATSIGLLANQRPILGAIYDPCNDDLFLSDGTQTTLNDSVCVCRSPDAIQSEEVINFGYNMDYDRGHFIAVVNKLLEANIQFRRLGSAALALAYVASGRIDGFWQMRLSAWDIAAGFALVQTSNGLVNNFFNGDAAKTTGEVLVSSRHLAPKLSHLTGVPLGSATK